MIKKLLFASVLAFGLTNAQTTIISEGFDDITSLTSWTQINKSTGTPLTGWFQGSPVDSGDPENPGPFDAYEGEFPDSYIGANFNNTSGAGTISNWLITPTLSLKNGDIIEFYTRTTEDTEWADRLQVRLSTIPTFTAPTGTGTTGANNVGSFTTLLRDINPTLAATGYPLNWTKYTITVTGLPTEAPANIAFRYFVTSGGPSGTNSNFIGIDSFTVTKAPTAGVTDINKKSVSIYPNPTTEVLNINVDSKINSADIYDIAGKLIRTVTLSDNKVNVKDLEEGTYVLKVNTEAGSTSHKFIKK